MGAVTVVENCLDSGRTMVRTDRSPANLLAQDFPAARK